MLEKKSFSIISLFNVPITPVVQEIVELASKHTTTYAEFRDSPEPGTDIIAARDYRTDEQIKAGRLGSIWVRSDQDVGAFMDEYWRLAETVKKPLDEPILPDDHPIHQGYWYVFNGKPVNFIDGDEMTVGKYKMVTKNHPVPIIEIRRCDTYGRLDRLPVKVETVRHEIAPAHKNKRRKPRNSNKIKKVMG